MSRLQYMIEYLCLLFHLSNALQCYEGVSSVPPGIEVPGMRGVLCSNRTLHRCIRAEIDLTVRAGNTVGSINVGRCARARECNEPCEQVLANLPGVSEFPLALFTVRKCEFACCDTDNCNESPLKRANDLIDLANITRTLRSSPFLFYSLEFPKRHIGIRNNSAHIVKSNGHSFHLVSPGLDGSPGSVSFLSTTQENHYLRHQRSRPLKLQPYSDRELYIREATFLPRYNMFYQGYTAYESINVRGYYIRGLSNNLTQISNFENTDSYKRSVSFKPVKNTISKSVPLNIHSLLDPNLCFGRSIGSRTVLVDCSSNNADSYTIVSPGLLGIPGSVSFQSMENSEFYLRQENSEGRFVLLDRFQDDLTYKTETSFMVRKEIFYPGHTGFESVLHPNTYLYAQQRNRLVSLFDLETDRDEQTLKAMAFAVLPN